MQTGLCKNCQTLAPAENYQMHVAHCKRNIHLCPLCGEAVSRREEKEHFEEYHTEIDCVQCGQRITRIEEGNHLAKECGKRPIPCKYCEISLPRENMTEHEEFCGSRTEFCQKCSRYVLIKDLQNHEKSCDGDSTRNAALPCEFCGAMIPSDRLDTHQRQCLVEIQGPLDDIPLLVEGTDGLFREIGASSVKVENNHEGNQTGSGNNYFTHSVSHEISTDVEGEENSIAALPCEICGELCPSDRLMQHQEECIQENESDHEQEFSTSGRRESDESHFCFVSGREMDNFFDTFTAERSTHDVLENLLQESLFRDLEGRMWPFELMRNPNM